MAKYQAYAEYKDSGVEWLGNIPKHWSVEYSKWLFAERNIKASVGDEMLTASQKYGVIPQKMFMELEQQKVVQVQLGHEILKRAEVNDFVISMRSFQGGIEYCGYKGAVSSAYVPLKPRQDLSISYYKYLFKSIPYIQALQTTTNLVRDGQALRFANFIQVRIPLLPYSEAEKIGQFLDHETAKIDHLIEKQQQLIELLKEKRQAVISHAVTKGLDPNVPMKDSGVAWLGEVPEHWSVKKLKYIVDLVGEKVESSNKQYVGMENISSKSGVFLQTEGILPEGISNTFNKGDILFGKLRPYLAKCWLADFSGICSSEFLVLRSKNKLSPIFLNLFLLTDQFIDQVNSSTYGSKMPRANWEFIGDLPIPVPDEQSSIDIANFLERQTQKYDSLIIKVSQQIALMQERRTALISAAVTGKIDVRHWQSPTVAETQTELSA